MGLVHRSELVSQKESCTAKELFNVERSCDVEGSGAVESSCSEEGLLAAGTSGNGLTATGPALSVVCMHTVNHITLMDNRPQI